MGLFLWGKKDKKAARGSPFGPSSSAPDPTSASSGNNDLTPVLALSSGGPRPDAARGGRSSRAEADQAGSRTPRRRSNPGAVAALLSLVRGPGRRAIVVVDQGPAVGRGASRG